MALLLRCCSRATQFFLLFSFGQPALEPGSARAMADSGSQSGTSDSGRPWEEEHEVHSPPAPEGPTPVDWAVKAPASPLLPRVPSPRPHPKPLLQLLAWQRGPRRCNPTRPASHACHSRRSGQRGVHLGRLLDDAVLAARRGQDTRAGRERRYREELTPLRRPPALCGRGYASPG